MKTVTMLEFRQDAERIINLVSHGERFVLTYRGRPVMRLEPMTPQAVQTDDPFYALADLADATADPVSNEDIDRTVYGA